MYKYRHGGNVHAEPGKADFLDFSASINPLGPPKQVQAAVRDAFRFVDRYPDSRSTELRESIAEFERVPPEWIFCAGGSSDILFRLPRCLKARSGLVLRPSFSDYERALAVCEAKISFHPLKEEAEFACDENLLKAVKTGPVDLFFLCNPNNPTGMTTDRRLIERILHFCVGTGTAVLIDECFMDLTSEADKTTAKPMLAEFKNLVVLKAFTKTFALPGLRLGYAICSDRRLIDELYFAGPDWPVSSPAQAAGIAALQDAGGYLRDSLACIGNERRFVKDELEGLGYRVFDGRANFLLVKNPYGFDIKKKLDEKRIRVRSFEAGDGLGRNYFRIGISTHENNGRLTETIREITNEKGGPV